MLDTRADASDGAALARRTGPSGPTPSSTEPTNTKERRPNIRDRLKGRGSEWKPKVFVTTFEEWPLVNLVAMTFGSVRCMIHSIPMRTTSELGTCVDCQRHLVACNPLDGIAKATSIVHDLKDPRSSPTNLQRSGG